MVMKEEDSLQSECVRWFRLQYPKTLIFAIPNGGQRNAVTGALLKKTGVMAGVADLFVMRPGGDMSEAQMYHGLFIEMKVGKNKQTESQVFFMDECERAGYLYRVCRSFDEFRAVVERYMKTEKQNI